MCGFVVRYDQRSRHSIGEFRIALPVGLSGTLESVPEVVVQVGLSEVLLAISVESRANRKSAERIVNLLPAVAVAGSQELQPRCGF
jgi:hypothetical protein